MNKNPMGEKIKILYKNRSYSFHVTVGSEGEKAIDISRLREKTSMITPDPGYDNTGSYTSPITFMDGGKGILKYRGIPVRELAKRAQIN